MYIRIYRQITKGTAIYGGLTTNTNSTKSSTTKPDIRISSLTVSKFSWNLEIEKANCEFQIQAFGAANCKNLTLWKHEFRKIVFEWCRVVIYRTYDKTHDAKWNYGVNDEDQIDLMFYIPFSPTSTFVLVFFLKGTRKVETCLFFKLLLCFWIVSFFASHLIW